MLPFFIILAFFRTMPQPAGVPVPVLCYHNITAGHVQTPSPLHISENELRDQLQTLADSGYHSIRPDELHAYLIAGKPLPPRPVLITFDDSHLEHFSIAAPVLEQAGFKGTFFVMTVTIGKKGYLSTQYIHDLHTRGHVIGCHTWDHPRISGNQGLPDAERQLRKARETLEKITGAAVTCFAYPFGTWNEAAVEQLRETGFQIAFQLSGRKMSRFPQFTVRRIMVNGNWKGARLLHEMRKSFSTLKE